MSKLCLNNKKTLSLVSHQSLVGKIESILSLLVNSLPGKKIKNLTFFLFPINTLSLGFVNNEINKYELIKFNEDQKYKKKLILDISASSLANKLSPRRFSNLLFICLAFEFR